MPPHSPANLVSATGPGCGLAGIWALRGHKGLEAQVALDPGLGVAIDLSVWTRVNGH